MEIPGSQFYRLIAPRFTLIISTIDKEGRANAAPFSFCMPVSMQPPLVSFASVPTRHTFINIKETKEFVINLPTKELLSAILICAKPFSFGVDEIKEAGLTHAEAKRVKPPRIKEAYGWIECGYKFDIEAGDHHIVVGEVIYAEVKEESFITPKGNLNLAELKPLLHLGGDEFAFPTPV